MSKYTDMIVDGVLCQFCGELISEEGLGYPGACAGCGEEETTQEWDPDDFGADDE